MMMAWMIMAWTMKQVSLVRALKANRGKECKEMLGSAIHGAGDADDPFAGPDFDQVNSMQDMQRQQMLEMKALSAASNKALDSMGGGMPSSLTSVRVHHLDRHKCHDISKCACLQTCYNCTLQDA